MSNSYSPKDRLQELLEYIQKFKYQDKFLRFGRKPSPDMSSFEKIQYASQAFLSGGLPNAETLEDIAISFDKYIRKKGEITLDEAFGLKSTPKAGKPSKQFAQKNMMNSMLFSMACIRRDNPSISVEKAALQVCDRENNYEKSSTLCREYSRGKWGDIEALIPKIMAGK